MKQFLIFALAPLILLIYVLFAYFLKDEDLTFPTSSTEWALMEDATFITFINDPSSSLELNRTSGGKHRPKEEFVKAGIIVRPLVKYKGQIIVELPDQRRGIISPASFDLTTEHSDSSLIAKAMAKLPMINEKKMFFVNRDSDDQTGDQGGAFKGMSAAEITKKYGEAVYVDYLDSERDTLVRFYPQIKYMEPGKISNGTKIAFIGDTVAYLEQDSFYTNSRIIGSETSWDRSWAYRLPFFRKIISVTPLPAQDLTTPFKAKRLNDLEKLGLLALFVFIPILLLGSLILGILMPIKQMGNLTIYLILLCISLCVFIPYSYALTYDYISIWIIMLIALPFSYRLMIKISERIIFYHRCPVCHKFGSVVVEQEILTKESVEVDKNSSEHTKPFSDWEETGPQEAMRSRDTEGIETQATTTSSYYDDHMFCKKCNHRWIIKRKSTSIDISKRSKGVVKKETEKVRLK